MKYSDESLRAHAYGRTRYTLSRATREQGLRDMETRENVERGKRSTACKYAISAKSAEGLIRDLLNLRGVGFIVRDESGHKVIDFAARPNRNTRGECFVYGRPADVKSGGTVNYAPPTDWDERDVVPNKEYIVFTLLEEASTYADPIDGLCDWTAILDRDTFITMCSESSRKGLKGCFHLTGATRGGMVLAYQATPLRKLREKIKSMIENGEVETLEGYLLSRAE